MSAGLNAPENVALHLREKDTGGDSCRTLAVQLAPLPGLRKSPSACLPTPFPPNVPPVAAHFEPVSNGGPRTDLPAEECVLLLIHQKARSFCPPVPEVRTERQRGEGRRYRPGRRETCAGRAAERLSGRPGTELGGEHSWVCLRSNTSCASSRNNKRET